MSKFVHMSKKHVHRGEIVNSLIRRKGVNLTTLAEEMGVKRQTLYNQLDRDDMNTSYILKIGEYINEDFSKLIPDLNDDLPKHAVHEPTDQPYKITKDPLDMMVRLDGSEETLNRVIDRLVRVNSSL